MSEDVKRSLPGLFGDAELSDCAIVFYLPDEVTNGPAIKRPRTEQEPVSASDDGGLQDGSQDNTSAMSSTTTIQMAIDGGGPTDCIGQALPAHRFILRAGSERFAAELQRWGNQQLCSSAAVSSSSGRPPVPLLRVSLTNEEDLPAARSAIQYLYSGQLQPPDMDFAGILRVRRLGSYLQVGGCVQACDAALRERLAAAGDGADVPLRFFACRSLFPLSSEEAAGFRVVLMSARARLVEHFGSAPAVLRSPEQTQLFCKLPPRAVWEVLASDDFATDDESSVLLLLAHWRNANPSVPEAALQQLCLLVRLVQLGDSYLYHVLPELDWFPLSRREHMFVTRYKTASPEVLAALKAANPDGYRLNSPRYRGPRKEAVPQDGDSFEWYISRRDLVDAKRTAQGAGGGSASAFATFAAVGGARGTGPKSVYAAGWDWELTVYVRADAGSAGVYLRCKAPAALGDLTLAGTNPLSVRVTVLDRNGQAPGANMYTLDCGPKFPVPINNDWGVQDALKLRAPAGAMVVVDPLGGAWDDWLREDKLTGTLTFKST